MSQENNHILSTIFLFGAGASIPAGIPSIDDMTKEFLENPLKARKYQKQPNLLDDDKSYKRKFEVLLDIAFKQTGKSDLETIMSVIINLQNEETYHLFRSRYYDEITKLTRKIKNNRQLIKQSYNLKDLLTDLRNKLEDYIRYKCESIKTTDYLWPLQALMQNDELNIFTLNYDATLEIFCEKNSIKFTDGFFPHSYWNSKNFEDTIGIKIFKLHGSLYWFRTESGTSLRVPIKGLRVSEVKYLTDESISEMMIYPTIQKNKQPIVYSWLSQKFKEMLTRSDTCIIIGYSFRDDDIKETILEALSQNPKLWLVLVSPHAHDHKKRVFPKSDEISSRIVVMNGGMEDAIRERNLHPFLQRLESARTFEALAWSAQQSHQNRFDMQYWNSVLYNYTQIEHDDRVKWVVEKLSQEKFNGIENSFPNTIEGAVCPMALRYAMEYNTKKMHEKAEIWLKIFVESCIGLEYLFFESGVQHLKENNPVKSNELPKWFKTDGSSVAFGTIEKMKKELERIEPKDHRLTFYKNLSKLIETLSILTFTEPNGQGGHTRKSPEEIVAQYKEKKLGMKEWAPKVADTLKQIG